MDKNEGQTELSVEELYQLVWEKPMQALSKDFGISDVGLAKICKRHNIPHPERGYWAKLYSGRKMKKPPLPKAARRNDIVCINRTETIEIPFDVPSSSQKIVIAPILESPHPLIELAKKNMRFSKHGHAFSESPDKMRCLGSGLVNCQSFYISVFITPEVSHEHTVLSFHRADCAYQTLFSSVTRGAQS